MGALGSQGHRQEASEDLFGADQPAEASGTWLPGHSTSVQQLQLSPSTFPIPSVRGVSPPLPRARKPPGALATTTRLLRQGKDGHAAGRAAREARLRQPPPLRPVSSWSFNAL